MFAQVVVTVGEVQESHFLSVELITHIISFDVEFLCCFISSSG